MTSTSPAAGGRPLGPPSTGTRRRTPRIRGAASSTAALLLLTVLVGVPLVLVVLRALLGHRDQPGALGTLVEPGNVTVITNTLVLGAMVVVAATLYAAPLAFLMSRTGLRRHRWIDVAVLIPFLTPPYISAMAWMEFTRPAGLAETWFGPFGVLLQQVFATPVGMAVVMGAEAFPLLYLILRNALDRVGANTDEAAAVHGATPVTWLRRVLIPMVAASYSLGALLVFVRAAGEFGTPVTLGNQIGFPVLVSQIHRDLTQAPLDFPRAAALSSVLLGLGITAWGLQQWFLVRRADRVTSVRSHREGRVRIGRAGLCAGWLWVGTVLTVTAVLPCFVLVSGSLVSLRSGGLALDNLTLDHYREVLTLGRGGMEALSTSAWLAVVTATLTTAAGTALALHTVRRRTRTARAVGFLALAPDMVPTIVLALGFIFLWNAAWLPATPYNTMGMLALGYCVIFLPLVVQNVSAARLQINDRLIEAAEVAGASSWDVTRRILMPLLFPGIVAGWLLAFSIGVRELVLSSLLRPPATQLLSTWILSEFDQGNRAAAMAMTVIAVFTSTAAMVAVDSWRSRRQRHVSGSTRPTG
ncbi:ABC transporter permease [Nocardiopsis nanhaiensis]